MDPETEHLEDDALRRALALDPDELAFLHAAALPARLSALIAASPSPRAQVLGLLWVVLPAAIAYAAWLVVAPLFAGGLELVAQAGGSALLASLIADALWGAFDSLASVVELVSVVPGFDAPLVTLSLVAAALYACAVLSPTRDVRPRASAV